MRQAGHYIAEYREVSQDVISRAVQEPGALHEVMITAVHRLGVDAAIIFADLLPMLEPMGVDWNMPQAKARSSITRSASRAEDGDRIRELESVGIAGLRHANGQRTRAAHCRSRYPVSVSPARLPFTLASLM